MMKWIFCILTIAPIANSKTIVVSDIDDTIKISRVLDKSDATKNAVRIDNQFLGMAATYSSIHKKNPEIQFHYISNALRSLMKTPHKAFLEYNKFPEGILELRNHLSDKNFKLNTLRKIITSEKPSTMILVGDNGERDPEVYSQIVSEFNQVQFFTFIHQIYSIQDTKDPGKRLEKRQVGFVTSVDLIQHLYSIGVLTKEDTYELSIDLGTKILAENGKEDDGHIAFPDWLNCKDYQFNEMKVETTQNSTYEKVMVEFWKHLRKKCH